MAADLSGRRIAILVGKGFEQVEMTEPRAALDSAGAVTQLVSPESGMVRAWNLTEWGDSFDVDVPIDAADAGDYDALLIPGGVMSPDRLRMDDRAVDFVRAFFEQGKPVASICHGPWILVEADVVKGRTVTSYPSLRTDLENAGAKWVDRDVVTDQGLVTSRNPDDIPAFNAKMIEEFAEGVHRGERRAA
ncbi:MAG TPA: type 1 glutamine amidotransferase domain-containing protein [Longimicrobiales bacterium]